MKRLFLKTLVASVALACVGVASAEPRPSEFATRKTPRATRWSWAWKNSKTWSKPNPVASSKSTCTPAAHWAADQANVSALQGGTLEMVTMNSGILANQVKEFEDVGTSLFMFNNSKEADAATDGPFGQSMHKKLETKGLIGLAYYELGFRHITNSRRPISKLEDFGRPQAARDPQTPSTWTGSKPWVPTPLPLPFPELYGALEQKAIDGQENPVSVILANKLYEVQKHLVFRLHQYNPQSVLISRKNSGTA